MNRVIPALGMMMILGSAATAQEPQVLFYLPFDGSANAAYSAGEAPMGGRAANDVLLYEIEGQFEEGLVGQGHLFDKAGLEYLFGCFFWICCCTMQINYTSNRSIVRNDESSKSPFTHQLRSFLLKIL